MPTIRAASRFTEMQYLKAAAPEFLAILGGAALADMVVHFTTGIPCWAVPGAVLLMLQAVF